MIICCLSVLFNQNAEFKFWGHQSCWHERNIYFNPSYVSLELISKYYMYIDIFFFNILVGALCTPFSPSHLFFFLCNPYCNFLFVLLKDSLRCFFIILFSPHLRVMCKCSSCGSKKYTPRRSNSTWIVIRNFHFLGFITFLFFS